MGRHIKKQDLDKLKRDIDNSKNIVVYGTIKSCKDSFILELLERLGDDYIGLCIGEMAYYCTLDDVWDASKRMVNYNDLDNLELFALAASHKVVIIVTSRDYYKEVYRIQKLLNNAPLIITADDKKPNSGYYTKEFIEQSTVVGVKLYNSDGYIIRGYLIESYLIES